MPPKSIGGEHYPYDRLDQNKTCEVCNKAIKARLVLIKKKAPKLCYRHWRERKHRRQREKEEALGRARGRRG